MEASGLHNENALSMAFYIVTHSGFVLVSMVCFSIVMSSLRDFLTGTSDNLQKVN